MPTGSDALDPVRELRFLARHLKDRGLDPAANPTLSKWLEDATQAATQSRLMPLAHPSVGAAVTAHAVRSLVQTGAEGLDEKLAEWIRNPIVVESLAYELKVAGHYAKRGLPVRFVPSGLKAGEQTYDFDVGGVPAFKVECKRLEPATPSVLAHERESDRALEGLSQVATAARAVVIEAPRLLGPGDADRLYAAAEPLVRRAEEGRHDLGDGFVMVLDLGAAPRMSSTAMGERRVRETMVVDAGGVHRGPVFEIDSMGPEDRSKKALALVKQACRQLGEGPSPGLVYLSVTGMTKRGLGGGLVPFSERVVQAISQHPHVSACIITVEDVQYGSDGVTFANQAKFAHNPKRLLEATPEMLPPLKAP